MFKISAENSSSMFKYACQKVSQKCQSCSSVRNCIRESFSSHAEKLLHLFTNLQH